MRFGCAALLYCAAVLSPLAAIAQQRTTAPDRVDPSVGTLAVQRESVFTGNGHFRDEKLAPWRKVNDGAARGGGHLGIFNGKARHAADAEGSTPNASTQSPTSATTAASAAGELLARKLVSR